MQLPPLDPVFPIPVIAAVTGVGALLAIVRVVWGRPLRPAWLQVPVLLLHLAALAVIAALLLNPSLPVQTPVPASRSLLLIDKSASMSLGAPGQLTRWQEAVKWVDEVSRDAVAAGLPKPVVIAFDTIAQPPAADLATVKPDGHDTNLSAALSQTLSESGAAPYDHVIVVSDGGARDRAALPAALALAHAQGVPISTRAVGTDSPPRNAWIASVQVPRIVRPRSRVALHASIAATGFTASETFTLALKDESGAVVTQTDFRMPGDSGHGGEAPVEQTLLFDSGLRTARYTLELLPSPGEISLDDNKVAFTLEAASTKLRVLYIQGTHSKRTVGTEGYALNDLELMTRAWDASGDIEYECLTPVSEYANTPNLVGVTFANGEMILDKSRSFPARREDLYRFDVMIIGNTPVGNFSQEQMQWVVDWVTQRGAGFCMTGGFTSFDSGHYDRTPWEKITPLDMVQYGEGYDVSTFAVAIPEAVRSHPLWRISPDPKQNDLILASHPPFAGMNLVHRAKPGAIVLATRPNHNNEPVIAAQTYGRGRSISYLSDPTGGWVKHMTSWGPPGGPVVGPQIELGQGVLHVDESAVQAATGPPPPYPCLYYGQFWVNVVKWLGENSIRWRRDKLAGRVVSAQAQPGKDLPVAAEVLAVSDPDELLSLDAGVRLDYPGSPRVRLEYDRDQREFTGKVPVPADVSGAELGLIFDATVAGESLTDTVNVGLRRVNPEFIDTAPDRAFLEGLAHAAGGQQLDTPAEAVALLRKSAEARARKQTQTWKQPLWTHWQWWAAIFAFLGAEWALRRFGGRPVTMAAIVLLMAFVSTPVRAVDPTPPSQPADIQALIPQLGARLVRQRDEAEAKLKAMFPAAAAAVKAAANDSTDEEIRLRALNILRAWQQNRWQLDHTLTGHRLTPKNEVYAVAVSPDRHHFYTRGQDFLREWNAETLEPGMMLGPVSNSWKNWEFQGPVSTLAISPDGEFLVITDDTGKVLLYRTADGTLATTLKSDDPSTIWSAAFFDNGKSLAVSDRNGAFTVWNMSTLKPVASGIPPEGAVASSMAVSPNGRFIVLCDEDLPGVPEAICIWDLKAGRWCARQMMHNKVSSIVFNRAGTEFIAASRTHSIFVWQIDAGGNISPVRQIGHFVSEVHDAIFSPDEKSIIATSEDPTGQLSEWDVATGDEIWRSLPLGVALHNIALIGDDRIVATGADAKVRIWRRSVAP